MKAGETAAIPFPLGSLGASFEDGLSLQRLLVVVALLENDETPQAALWAGCKAFSSELDSAISENLSGFFAAITQAEQGNDEPLKQLIQQIKNRVKTRVYSATWDALTGWQKARVLLGTLNLDDYIGADYFFSAPVRTTFRLSLKTDNSSNEYTLDGMLDVHAPPVAVDLCQAQVDRAKEAKAVVDGIDAQINVLKQELQNATPPQKAAIVAQIKRLNHELGSAMAALEEARQALQDCRDHWLKVSETKGAATGVGGTANI